MTGTSTPIFGVSWNPSEADSATAKRIINFLEDRRVLYAPSEMEVPRHCVDSVLHIRRFLTSEVGRSDLDSELAADLKAMRKACRKFLQIVNTDPDQIIPFASQLGHYASWIFYGSLGEMRGVFGIHIAKIAAQYGLDIEDELASILPASMENDTAPPARL